MLISLLKFELKYQFKQPTFIIALILFFVFGCFAATTGGFGGSEVHKNAPYVITNIVALFSLLCIFATTLFCANVVLRDSVYKMDSVLYTTSLSKQTYVSVRFLGLFLAVFALMVFTVIGIFFGTFLVVQSDVGEFNFIHYVYPLVVFALPNVFFACSLIFCTAILTKNIRAIYVAGVLLYILYMAASILGNSPLLATSAKFSDPSVLPFLIDPFGLASFFSETRNWTDLQRNQQLFPIGNTFLINRLLWLTISAFVMFLGYRFFNFRLTGARQSKSKPQSKSAIKKIPFRHFNVKPIGIGYDFLAFKSQFKLEVISLFKHIPFMVMLLLWVFLFGIELKDTILHGPYGIKYFPTTGAIVEEMRSLKFAFIVLVFYAAELVAREKTSNIQALIYGTPVKGGVLWGAKSLTLMVLVMILVTVNILIGVALQLFNGYQLIEFPTYFSLYYYSAVPLFLFVLLIVFVQSLVGNKYIGMLLSMLVVFSITFASRLGIDHFLLRFASVPDLQFSDFNNFGHYANAFNWYMLYWFGFSIILVVLTVGMWRGSGQFNFLERLKSLYKSLPKTKYLLAFGLLIWLGTGSFVYRQTNLIGKYLTKQEALDWPIDYEKKYKSFSNLPQPIIKTVTTKLDLFPSENRYEISGVYLLENESAVPIKRLLVSLHQSVSKFSVQLPNAINDEVDTRFNQQFITLKTPLEPGKEIKMSFSISVIRSGFMPFDSENSLVSNGSYIELEKFIPHFGYNPYLEIEDAVLRKKAGLPKHQIPSFADKNYHLINFESTISTQQDQQVVTVGTFQKSWTKNGRNYFHYKTASPINFMLAMSSAKYQVKKEFCNGVTLKAYYHLGHENNVETMFEAMRDALAYGNANFHKYPLKQLSLAEIPQYKGAATAYPGVIFNAERINYLTNYADENLVNQTYAITAHEVAHQWWANILAPADGMGYAMLTESLAKYTEAMLLEKKFGKMYLRNYLSDDNNLYFVYGNPNAKELPLAKTYDQNNVHYQKGSLVFYAMKEVLGEEKLNQVLHDFIQKHANPNEKAQAQDLVKAILDVAPSSQKSFIKECFNEVVDYRMSVELISCKALPNGKFKVDLKVEVAKHKRGEEKLLAPDMDVDLAFFDVDQLDFNKKTRPFYSKKHRFNKFSNQVSVIVDRKPRTIALDPYAYLLDANLKDNMVEFK
ncbi:MAG: hypothetical protein EOO47_00890 [Flavobacterium sp.]|nr:MAG: hypothetical protein EOO47_00890 [Flavobacterium sp.]